MEDPDELIVPTVVQQTIYGNVGKLAGRDINEWNLSAVVLLDMLTKAVDESADIPADEKQTLLEKLRELRDNPWVVNIGTGAILATLKTLFG